MRFVLAILLCIGSSGVIALEFNGQAEFARRVALNSSISGRVQAINVTPGQAVTRGEILLNLVPTGLQANVTIAESRVKSLQPTVDRMLTELEKAQELFARDSLALIELQSAEQNHSIAAAKLAEARARLVRAQYRRSQADIRSPIDGIVTSIETFTGQYINTAVSNQTLLTIIDNESMIVQSLLPLEAWTDSLMGKPAQVSFQQQRYQGRVIDVSKELVIGDNSHPAFALRVEFVTGGRLHSGLPVKVSIEENQ